MKKWEKRLIREFKAGMSIEDLCYYFFKNLEKVDANLVLNDIAEQIIRQHMLRKARKNRQEGASGGCD